MRTRAPTCRETPSQAWTWRQIQSELDRRASVSIDELQTSIERAAAQMQGTTIDLIDNLAWMFQARRTSLPQRQALYRLARHHKEDR